MAACWASVAKRWAWISRAATRLTATNVVACGTTTRLSRCSSQARRSPAGTRCAQNRDLPVPTVGFGPASVARLVLIVTAAHAGFNARARQIVAESGPAGAEDRKAIALIAYLMRLGTDLDKPMPTETPATPSTEVADADLATDAATTTGGGQ